MKKFLTLVAVAAFAITSTAFAKDWKKIRVGTEGAYPPFNAIDESGKLIGFDIDIANALCEELNAECTFVVQDWDGIIPALLARKYDAIIASMSITDERKKKVSFTTKYYDTPTAFVAKEGAYSDVNANILRGKTVGVQGATIFDKYLTEVYGGKGVNIKRYKSMDDVYLDLTAGRLDLMLGDALVLLGAFLEQDMGKGYGMAGPLLLDREWFGDGIGIAIRKQDKELVDKFNSAIRKIRQNGVYAKINAKYFEFDIYGD